MIKTVSVSEIMKKLHITYDGFKLYKGVSEWFYMLEDKLADGQVPAIIDAIETQGFTDPICIEDLGNGKWKLGNGHHRLCIAIMLGLDEIPVDFSRWYSVASTENQKAIWDAGTDAALADWIASFWTNAAISY